MISSHTSMHNIGLHSSGWINAIQYRVLMSSIEQGGKVVHTTNNANGVSEDGNEDTDILFKQPPQNEDCAI